MEKTLVLGIGNSVLCDDGVGIRVAIEVGKRISDPAITIAEACQGGLFLLEAFLGYDHIVLIDAIQTKDGIPGQVYELQPENFSSALHLSSPHQVDFATALELGKSLGLPMPSSIDIVAVEAGDVTTFREKCTPEVENAIPVAVEMALRKCPAHINHIRED
ncbi:MAG: hydrogenase maturation protease [Proteobacteria bacterium]|nr:hydrogenase maturation protease [Pseudomonadota bacterium]